MSYYQSSSGHCDFSDLSYERSGKINLIPLFLLFPLFLFPPLSTFFPLVLLVSLPSFSSIIGITAARRQWASPLLFFSLISLIWGTGARERVRSTARERPRCPDKLLFFSKSRPRPRPRPWVSGPFLISMASILGSVSTWTKATTSVTTTTAIPSWWVSMITTVWEPRSWAGGHDREQLELV